MLASLLALTLAAAPAPAEAPAPDFATKLVAVVEAAYDSARGGYVTGGAPVESAVELAFVRARAGDAAALERALVTMNWTRGLLDTVGGGYFDDQRSADPMSPVLVKSTATSARRLELLADALEITQDLRWRKDALAITDFMDRVLLDGRGGFVSGQIADRGIQPEANGYAIAAWLRWAAAISAPGRRDFALLSLDRVWEVCGPLQWGLLRRGSFGNVESVPKLRDQVEMGRAYVLAAHLVGRPRDRERAEAIGNLLLEKFEDPEKGGFRNQFVGDDHGNPKRAARLANENARAARFFAELAVLTGEPKYAAAVLRTAAAFEKDALRAKLGAADWAMALQTRTLADLPDRPTWMQLAPEPVKPKAAPARKVR